MMETVPHQPLEWPGERRVYLTLDLECDYGTALPTNRYTGLARAPALVDRLEAHDVPLTVFVQTAVLDEAPDAIEQLRSSDVPVEFHAHSHTHAPRTETDVDAEIRESTQRYEEFFGAAPSGYRFPNGNVRPRDFDRLAAMDYTFDASLLPSWRPGHFDNTGAPRTPLALTEADLLEVPFTVASTRIPIPTTLSAARVLGAPFHWVLDQTRPPTVVFNLHMHDLFTPPSASGLPLRYRLLYARNQDGFDRLDRMLRAFRDRGYEFWRFTPLVDSLSP